jgi:hypothetical protein
LSAAAGLCDSASAARGDGARGSSMPAEQLAGLCDTKELELACVNADANYGALLICLKRGLLLCLANHMDGFDPGALQAWEPGAVETQGRQAACTAGCRQGRRRRG